MKGGRPQGMREGKTVGQGIEGKEDRMVEGKKGRNGSRNDKRK